MRNLSAHAIRNPMPVAVLFLVLALGGVLGFRALPVTLSPDTSFPVAVVTAVDPGADPADLAQSVTEPIEDAVAAIAGVHHVLSQTASGIATITVEFNIGVNPDAALAAVRAAVDTARERLPPGLQPPSVTQLETQGGPVLTYAVADPSLSVLALGHLVRTRVMGALSDLPGVATVTALGARSPEIRIAADPARLATFGLTLPALDRQIRAAVGVPQSGTGMVNGAAAPVSTRAAYDSAASLSGLPIALASGVSVPLGAIASVRKDAAPAVTLARLDGSPVVAFAIWSSPGSDALKLAGAVQATLNDLTVSHPGLVFTRVAGTVDETRSSYDTALEALLEGLLLAAATVWLFLRNLRATVIAALAMPLSLLPVFLVLMLLGQSLNSITLLALALVVGILVDDAIVEIENIQRHISMGKRPYRAALDAADEIGPAVVATSFAIIAVFLPVSMMQGVVGQYFKPFGLAVAVAVFASLLVARLFTPLLAAFFLVHGSQQRRPESSAGWLQEYRVWLDRGLANPRTCLIVAGGVLALTVLVASLLPIGFLPAQDQDESHVALILPPGSTVETADLEAAGLSRVLLDTARLHRDIKSVFTLSGGGNAGGIGANPAAPNDVAITVLLRADRPDTRTQFEAKLRTVLDSVPDLDWHMTDQGSSRDVELDFTGGDPAVLGQAMQHLATEAAFLPGLSHVQTSLAPYATDISITLKEELATTLGVTTADLAGTLVLATGTVLPAAPVVSEAGTLIPLRLELAGAADEAALGQLPIRAGAGEVPLALVADLGIQPGPALITRVDRTPMAGIGADLLPGTTLGQALHELRALPAYRPLATDGVTELDLGAAEFMRNMFAQFSVALGGGLLVLLGVMLLLFRNWLQPLTVLATLPLSVGGALLALLLGGFALDLSSSIGLLALLGIVTKNAILMVDAALTGERAGLPRVQAARDAGMRRARPVVMTSMAMVAGMIPVTLTSSAGASLRQPMAFALIGGLLASTALSLFLVPVFYVLIGNVTDRLAPVFARLVTTVPTDFE
ncbi:MAG TPA: efflux RND transporter permease subunit [Acidocella sp.]|uniref:efflux RND transporter permease subunit n=1 Tax=Acidocella sp. TaxID=50710 RepID=UPI002C162748|nr:efflux RND transporter permease subunit [Acidocella sp.]HVE23111.1 efflux RND transporter permease subunit [Acidocella sp.]